MVVASPIHLGLNSATTLSDGTKSEVAAVVDSKGIVHAAWVEHPDQSAGSTPATLWYSTYDPESVSSRSTRRLDTYDSIYSLSMAIGSLDDVHMVWVRKSMDTYETHNLTMNPSSTNSRNAIYYQDMNPRGALAGSPRSILESQADTVWASITAGRDSELYLAWLDVLRSNSTDVESDVYYARLGPHDRVAKLAGTLVTNASTSSRLLKVAASTTRNNLHIAWVEETGDATSRVVDWEVDLAENSTRTVNVNEVRGQISQLTLAAIQNGEVVLGYAYQESAGNSPKIGVAQYAISHEGIARVVEIPLQHAEEPESVAVDTQGNLHIVWAYPLEEVKAGPRPIPIWQQGFRHAEYSSEGQLTEETEETSYIPAVAVFVIGNGEVYVVSGQGTLRATDPVPAGNPAMLLFALVMFASLVGGMSTEPATYLIASWSIDRSLRTVSTDVGEKLLRRIRRRPGIALAELKLVTERSGFFVATQLRALERMGMIRSIRDGRRQRFYYVVPKDGDQSHAEELRRSIVRLVDYTPGITEAQIARSLGLSQQLTNYHLRRLVDAGLLSRFRCPDNICYNVKDQKLASSDWLS
jgi:predicted transcriptional regulator